MKPGSSRVSNLLRELRSTEPEVFGERALIVTRAYMQTESEPFELRQAKAFADLLNEYPTVIQTES